MGAFSGNLTYKQYYVKDALEEGWGDTYEQAIKRHVFRPLTPESDLERTIGWCSPHFPLDLELHSGVYLYNEYITLAMRVDTWTVPASTLKIYTEAETRRVMQEQNRATVSRYERVEIRDRVKMDLRRKTLPAIKTVDMVWNWQTGRVRFFSSSQRLNLEFVDLFEDTFHRSLLPDGAYGACQMQDLGLSEEESKRLEYLDPVPFVDASTAAQAMGELK